MYKFPLTGGALIPLELKTWLPLASTVYGVAHTLHKITGFMSEETIGQHGERLSNGNFLKVLYLKAKLPEKIKNKEAGLKDSDSKVRFILHCLVSLPVAAYSPMAK